MEKDFESRYHKLEEDNWWFVARREIVIQLLSELKIKDNSRILEIGCSGGALLKNLKSQGFKELFGVDISEVAIELCRKRGIENVQTKDGVDTRYMDSAFDLIIASDVLEHIETDAIALKEWYRVLRPGGILIVFVPAFNFLWSNHDDLNHHYRRYGKKQLNEKLIQAGFGIIRSSFWNFVFLIPVAIVSFMGSIFLKKEDNNRLYEFKPWLNSIFLSLLRAENLLLKYTNLPSGVSIFTVSKK